MTDTHDRWYRWLREVRHGGDAGQLEQLRPELRPLVEAGHGSDRRAVAYLTAGGADAARPKI